MGEEVFYYTDLFKKISNGQKIMLNRGMSQYGITYVQSLVIVRLSHMRDIHGEDYVVNQKEIEDYLSLAGSTVAHILNRLEENGCIRKIRSSRDSRVNQLILTDKGLSFVPIFYKVLDDVETTMTAGMNSDEKKALKQLMEKVIANMRAQRK